MNSKRHKPVIKKANSKVHDDRDWFKRAEHFLLRTATLITLLITLFKVIIPEAEELKKYFFPTSTQPVIQEKSRLVPDETPNH
ncbi:MAG TPA: hypothetical protein VGN86_01030 [Pyrinomonadaceae bacterium]|jgi:hypothetical protein|nr:hypothetical protein [Pyrinomonadaceae bacterium]